MKKIYLFCSAGMSTSMLARNMQKVADEHGLEAKVEAFASGRVSEVIKNEHPDCVLLGPQVAYMLEEVQEAFASEVPIGIIKSDDYGALDGERVLKYAVILMRRFSA